MHHVECGNSEIIVDSDGWKNRKNNDLIWYGMAWYGKEMKWKKGQMENVYLRFLYLIIFSNIFSNLF